MEETFTNKELAIENLPQFETVTFNPVSKKLLYKNLTKNTILFVLILAGSFIYNHYESLDEYAIVLLSSAISFVLLFMVNSFLKQKKYGFALREKDIMYKQGFIVNSTTVIPFNRVQHSIIKRSLLDKIYGIATLNIYTAGGSGSDISIQGLKPELAKDLNETVSQKIAVHE